MEERNIPHWFLLVLVWFRTQVCSNPNVLFHRCVPVSFYLPLSNTKTRHQDPFNTKDGHSQYMIWNYFKIVIIVATQWKNENRKIPLRLYMYHTWPHQTWKETYKFYFVLSLYSLLSVYNVYCALLYYRQML